MPASPDRLMRSLRLAVGLLTVVPVRNGDPNVDTARNAILLAPLAGLLAGLPGLVLLVVLDRPAMVVAALAIASLAAMTGALHWDGLADTADGFAVPRGRDDRLEVMRRPDLGPIGALALGLTLLLQVGALAALSDWDSGAGAWLFAVALSRAALPLVCLRGTTAARPNGLGALVIGRVPRLVALVPAALVMAVAVPTVATPARTAVAGLAALGVAWSVRAAAVRRFGGLTGDVLGAVVELSAAACLIALCVEW
jgi:adenosylcobinamide-GDP ribazoletransferase